MKIIAVSEIIEELTCRIADSIADVRRQAQRWPHSRNVNTHGAADDNPLID